MYCVSRKLQLGGDALLALSRSDLIGVTANFDSVCPNLMSLTVNNDLSRKVVATGAAGEATLFATVLTFLDAKGEGHPVHHKDEIGHVNTPFTGCECR
jgi:hypothetical protein